MTPPTENVPLSFMSIPSDVSHDSIPQHRTELETYRTTLYTKNKWLELLDHEKYLPYEKALFKGHPTQRVISLRSGQELDHFDGRWLKACLIYEKGDIVQDCNYCAGPGRGKFVKCVKLRGHFKDCCANCKWVDQGCSNSTSKKAKTSQ